MLQFTFAIQYALEALKAAGCEVIRSEKVSGTTRQGRSELATLLEFVREGDSLVVERNPRYWRKDEKGEQQLFLGMPTRGNLTKSPLTERRRGASPARRRGGAWTRECMVWA